jgi:hypothetical protein
MKILMPGGSVGMPGPAVDRVGRERRVQGEAGERLGQMDGVRHGSLLGSAWFALPIIAHGEAGFVAAVFNVLSAARQDV